jgi:lipase chaperone LimK
MKSRPARIPQSMYDYLKKNALEKDTSVRIEANTMFNKYIKYKQEFKKLEGKRLFTIK